MRKQYALVIILIYLSHHIACSQSNEEPVSTFSNRMTNPVTVNVTNSGRDINFIAENLSFFPYHIEIQFTNFVNLTPVMRNYKADIYHGKTVLFTLTVADIGSYHDYSYNFQFRIGYDNKKAGITYPYSLPLGEGKTIKLSKIVNGKDTTFFRNVFMLNRGDTIFCMRKGIITNTLSSGDNFDRILKAGNVEVIHSDGTVATYSIPGEDNLLVVPGQQVYPSQPLMIVKKPGNLTIQMCAINDTAVKTIDFRFEHENTGPGDLDGKIVRHSPVTTEIELTDKEKKKLAKGNLF